MTTHYYNKNGWSSVYIYYTNGITWSTSPGILMNSMTGFSNWYTLVVTNYAANTNLMMCFNNGSGTWDNNSSANYSTTMGNFWLSNTTFYANVSYTVTNVVTARYYDISNWTSVYMHYSNGVAWTTSPGKQMSAISGYTNWYQLVVTNYAVNTNLQMCFDNGGTYWDNNGTANYNTTMTSFWLSNKTFSNLY